VPDFIDCSAFPDYRSAPYVLPFPVGQRFQIGRTFGHYSATNGGAQRFAIDVNMAIGTPAHAMRPGVVAAVEERYSDDDHTEFHENFVMVRHTDNTVARYLHLTASGASVEVGEAVTQGQMLASSGNSGASSAPHLHFDVQACGPNPPGPAYNAPPFGMTVPLSFRNTDAQTCGLETGRSYTAQPLTADAR
jgi:murein DD-endopeptidase MepM/ murein hydrolase activator NlpD